MKTMLIAIALFGLVLTIGCTTVQPAVIMHQNLEKVSVVTSTNSGTKENGLNPQNVKKSIQAMEQELKRDPRNTTLLLNLASVYLLDGNLSQAQRIARKVLTLSPANIEATKLMARIYFNKGKFQATALICRNLIFKKIKDSEIYNILGLSEYKLGQVSAAIKSINLSIEYNPQNVAARMNLGIIFLDNKDFTHAGEQFQHVMKLVPESNIAGNYMAIVYSQMGRIDESVALYEKIIESDRYKTSALYNLALIYKNHLKDYAQAETYMGRFINESSKQDAKYQLALQIQQEIKDMQKPIDINKKIEEKEEVADTPKPKKKVKKVKVVKKVETTKVKDLPKVAVSKAKDTKELNSNESLEQFLLAN